MRTRETLKDLLIVVLVLGMAYLAVMTWMANNPNGEFFGLFSGEDASLGELAAPDVDAYPLSVSVRTASGRHSAVYDASAVEFAYRETEEMLETAVQSAKGGIVVKESVWQTTLTENIGVLYDYQCDVPMSVFAFWYGNPAPEQFDGLSVRYLCLASEGDAVCLLVKPADGSKCFLFETDVPENEFLEKLLVFKDNSCRLGLEAGRDDTPEVLLSPEVPQVSELRAVNAAQTFGDEELDRLLRTFRLNPNTVSRHVEQDGSRVFVEDNSTVKITADGVVTYSDLRADLEYNTGITVQSAHEMPTVWEKTETARELVSSIDVLVASSGRLYLESVREVGDAVEVFFGREVGGVPVDFGGDRAIARVVIRGNRVSEAEFVLRRYSASGTKCILMPSNLAAATAAGTGKELFLRYLDTAQETVRAEWYLK